MASSGSLENYDPTAALLIFSASSDKLSIESRCNTRLVYKTSAKHQLPSGQLIDATAPINFSQLQLQLDTSDDALELHTSAHCFFRVWDPRIEAQVKLNPDLKKEPVRSDLQDMKTRYQLYRSLLTKPQTIVTYLPDGTPVTFKYKLQSTPIFESLFAAADKENSRELEKIIGREFSKTSVILDEFVRDGCRTDDKLLANLGPLRDQANTVKDFFSLNNFFQTNLPDNSTVLTELGRRRVLTAGRHKLCFSQTDMVVAPVRLFEEKTPPQKALLAEIAKIQKERILTFTQQIDNETGRPRDSLKPNVTTSTHRFIPEISASTQPLPVPEGLSECSYRQRFPGFSSTDVTAQLIEKNYAPKWSYSSGLTPALVQQIKFLFPNLVISQGSADSLASVYFSSLFEEIKCETSGFKFRAGVCTSEPNEQVGRCPAIRNNDPASQATADLLAQKMHNKISTSFRLASTAPIHMTQQLRDSSLLALTMPIAALRDYTTVSCINSENNECNNSKKLSRILDSLLGKYSVAMQSGRQVDVISSQPAVILEGIDKDLQYRCELIPTKTASNAIESLSWAFQKFSSESKKILVDGVQNSNQQIYDNVAARFLHKKCISAAIQRLHNGFLDNAGLLHGINFTEFSFVKADSSALGTQRGFSNAELTQSGQPIRLPLSGFFFGQAGNTMSSSELAARLLGGPHIQVSICKAAGATGDSICAGVEDNNQNIQSSAFLHDLPLVQAHIVLTTKVPHWLSDEEKAAYGTPAFPEANYSPESARYFLSSGDSGTTISTFGLWPIYMLSAVQDQPVSGGLAVIPSTGGQEVQPAKKSICR